MRGSAGELQVVLTGLESLGASVERLPARRSLTLRRLGRWAHSYDRLFRRSSSAASDQLHVYQQAAKLVEEVGELHAALLAAQGLQRPGKYAVDAPAVQSELADVVICAAILASALDIDLEVATQAKMDIVDRRMGRTA